MRKKLAILISNTGTGTNLQAMIDAIDTNKLNAQIVVVVSGSPNAHGLRRARKSMLPCVVVAPEANIAHIVKRYRPDFLVLAGWKRIIPDTLIDTYSSRILNIHPGLIPDSAEGSVKAPDGSTALWNKGMMSTRSIQKFLDAKATYAGSSVHFLTYEFDFGPVLGRCFEIIRKGDSVDSLYTRLKLKENALYVEALERICNDSVEKKSVLILGSGAREHAIGWKLRQSPHVGKIYFAPGNGGTREIGENVPLAQDNVKRLATWAKQHSIDLTVVGPESALALGVVDEFKKKGLTIFGPNKGAARLESSKSWAMDFMKRHAISAPQSFTHTNATKAKKQIDNLSWQGYVIKADGLAAGKGVFVCDSAEEAKYAIDQILRDHAFGKSGKQILIQERLVGEEVSVMAFSDGTTVIPLLPVQDHKRIYDQDKGPNTGGMGAYAPYPKVTGQQLTHITRTILQKTIDGLRAEGIEYKGVLYAGLMLTKTGPKVLEYNVRFGDPETQPLMMLLESDLCQIFMKCIQGTLKKQDVVFRPGAGACVVLAAKGYPGTHEKGKQIKGLSSISDQNVRIFHASTTYSNGQVRSAGGRVLGVCAYSKDLKTCLRKIYHNIGKDGVNFVGMQYRKDIGRKGLRVL